MPFLAASASFTRYRILDEIPQELWAEIPAKLKSYAFRDIDHTSDERSFGWVSFDDWLDPDYTKAPPEKGHFLAFQLRLDTRRIQPAVFKKHLQLAMRAELEKIADETKRYLSKDRKNELKEQVALRLRARALPVPAVFDVVWNVQDQTVLLGTTNSKIRTMFEDQFTLTFGLTLEPQTPFFRAVRLLGEEAVQRLENLEPTSFAV